MSRLYASIDSDSRKTQVTSRGHRHIESHTRGWNLGVQVIGSPDVHDEQADAFYIYATSGSTGGRSTLMGTLRLIDSVPNFEPAYLDNL